MISFWLFRIMNGRHVHKLYLSWLGETCSMNRMKSIRRRWGLPPQRAIEGRLLVSLEPAEIMQRIKQILEEERA